MATTWCKPLAAWETLFTQWIVKPEPQALMAASIFFDFRSVHGVLSLEPLEQILSSASEQPLFIAYLVRSAQEFVPPLGFFGRIRSEEGSVDLKKGGIAPIVGLARACALAAGSRERSTLERLISASATGKLSHEGAEILAETFQFLMALRLREQLAALRAGAPPTNQVRLQALSAVERRHLKDAFVSIRQMQDGLGAAFQTGRMG
jgi:CBS domain-containing protein